MKLHPTDVLRIAAEAGRHPDTVRAVLDGRGNEMSKRPWPASCSRAAFMRRSSERHRAQGSNRAAQDWLAPRGGERQSGVG